MEALSQAVQIAQQQQDAIPVLVKALQDANAKNRVDLAEVIQRQFAPEQNRVIEPVRQVLEEDTNRDEPIDIIERLWDLQTDLIWMNKPTERIERIKAVIAKYLVDTGIYKNCPESCNEWFQEFSRYNDSEKLIKFFNRWYPEWIDIQFAIADGLIKCPLDYFRWVRQGKRQQFQWGKRTIQKLVALRDMPPASRGWVNDPEYQIDLFASRARIFVRKD